VSPLYYLMAMKNGYIGALYTLGLYYMRIGNYQQMEAYHLMAINRGEETSLCYLTDHYLEYNKIEEMVNCNLIMIEKFNNPKALCNLTKYYQNDPNELLNQIELYKEIKKRKEKYSRLIIKELPVNVSHFRFRDQSLGSKIIKYHFKLNNSVSEEHLYQQLKDTEPLILDYLTIVDKSRIKEKIDNYLNTLST